MLFSVSHSTQTAQIDSCTIGRSRKTIPARSVDHAKPFLHDRSIAQNHSCTIGRSRKTIFLHDRSIAQTCSLRDRSMVARTVDLPIAQCDRSIAQIDRSPPNIVILLINVALSQTWYFLGNLLKLAFLNVLRNIANFPRWRVPPRFRRKL